MSEIQKTPNVSSPSKKVVLGVGGISSILIGVIKNDYWTLDPNLESMFVLIIPLTISGIAIGFEYLASYMGWNSKEDVAFRGKIKRDLKENEKALKDPFMQDANTQKQLKENRLKIYTSSTLDIVKNVTPKLEL